MSTEPTNPNADSHRRDPREVEFADTFNHKYPIDTPEHVRAAWSYIHISDNAAKYTPEQIEDIKARIRSAAVRHGVEVSEEHEREKERQRAIS